MDAEPEPRLREPGHFAVAGSGAAGIFYPEPEAEREPVFSQDPGSAQGMCKIFRVAGLWSRNLLELELE